MNRAEWIAKYKSYGHSGELSGASLANRKKGLPAHKAKKMRRPAPPVEWRNDECPQCSRVMTPGALRCKRCTAIRLNAEAAFSELPRPEK